MDDDRIDIPQWRIRREENPEREWSILRHIGIPRRYAVADLQKDFPLFGFDQETSYYLHGEAGSGKTHMLCAMVRERTLARFDRRECLFVTVDDALSEIRSTFNRPKRNRDEEEEDEATYDCYTTRLKEVSILALDDIGAERVTDWTLGELYSILNTRYNELRVTYLSSNLCIEDLSTKFSQRIASRLYQMCQVVHLGDKDRRLSVL
jgi:DNA replication protein DnaC